MKKHTVLKNKIKKMIAKEFPQVWTYFTSDIWKSGIPDILLCIEGKFVAMEIKIPPDSLKRLQYFTLEQIKKAKGEALVVNSVDNVKEVIERFI